MSEKIYVQIDNVKKELTGQELDDYLTDLAICNAELLAVKAEAEAEAEAKAEAKATAEGKLAALGLTTDDLRALGL
jgi:hypothetical protein